MAGLNAFLEAIPEDSAAVAAAVEAAAVEESIEAAAAVTMMEMMVGGVTILGPGRAKLHP